jgi:hypothetical protein
MPERAPGQRLRDVGCRSFGVRFSSPVGTKAKKMRTPARRHRLREGGTGVPGSQGLPGTSRLPVQSAFWSLLDEPPAPMLQESSPPCRRQRFTRGAIPSPNRCHSRIATGYAGWRTSRAFHRHQVRCCGAKPFCRVVASVSTPRPSRESLPTCRRARPSWQTPGSNPSSMKPNSSHPRPRPPARGRDTPPSSSIRRSRGPLGLANWVVRWSRTGPGGGGGEPTGGRHCTAASEAGLRSLQHTARYGRGRLGQAADSAIGVRFNTESS